MATRVAINGFGRIGRLFLRALLEKNMFDNGMEVVAINDLVPAENLAYLLEYDTTHGRLNYKVKISENDFIEISDTNKVLCKIKTLSMKVNPSELPWKDLNIDVVIESTGFFTKREEAFGHIKAGAKKVIISAPSDESVKTILMGVNHEDYNDEEIISNASCTTNCLGPIVHVLLKEGIGIEEGLMTTNHAYTASQSLLDGVSRKSFRDGRAAAENIIPASTGAAKAIGNVIPEMKGKLTGMAFRVPVKNVSVVDLTFKPARETSLDEINSLIKKASETYMKGIIEYTKDPVVSSDFNHNPHSAIYDSTAGIELNSKFFKIIAWYDNEWGYSNRLAEVLKVVSKN